MQSRAGKGCPSVIRGIHLETSCHGAGCCDPCNEKALRASRGAAFKLPLASGDWQVSEYRLRAFLIHCTPAWGAEADAYKLLLKGGWFEGELWHVPAGA